MTSAAAWFLHERNRDGWSYQSTARRLLAPDGVRRTPGSPEIGKVGIRTRSWTTSMKSKLGTTSD